MAHRLLLRGCKNVPTKAKYISQHFNYLLILDFEATCEKEAVLQAQEIIEFPCIALSTRDWQVKDVFHKYVKPRINPNLSPFCTELTGIMQETIDKQSHFPEVFGEFKEWLEEEGFFAQGNRSAFVTCGDWDLKVMLPNQCKLENLPVPKHFSQWIDLKKTFCESTNHFPRSLKDMLAKMEIPSQGRSHSGICDAQNMTQIILELQKEYNTIFQINSVAKAQQ